VNVGQYCGDAKAPPTGCSYSTCTSPDGRGGYDCWAGTATEACTCSSGEARVTNTKVVFGTTYYQYACCTGGVNVGRYCGDAKAPPPGCSFSACTSPDGRGGYDCWAGSALEPCTCSSGKARETGVSSFDPRVPGRHHYQYSCCTSGANQGEHCGDFYGWVSPILCFVAGLIVIAGCCRYRQKQAAKAPTMPVQGRTGISMVTAQKDQQSQLQVATPVASSSMVV
jgi:hypothetical protein